MIYEDNHLLVVNKPGGLLSQGDQTGDNTLLDQAKEYIKKKYNKPGNVYCGLVHRLDRPTSGMVILAKTSKALERMNQVFRERKIKKTYWAILENFEGKESGTLISWILRNEDKNRVHVFKKEKKGAQRAELDYSLLAKIGSGNLLEIDLKTGRHHQIRAQFGSLNMPVRGDKKYGSGKQNRDGSICLHCRKLSFEHPVKKETLELKCPVPNNGYWQDFKGFDA